MSPTPSIAPRLARLFLAVFTVALLALPATAEPVRTFEQTYFIGDAEEVEVDLTIGSITIEGVEDTYVRAEVRLSCDRADAIKCRERAGRIQLAARTSGQELRLDLEGTPRGKVGGITAEVIVKVPRHLDLDVELGGGDILVRGMHGNVEIDSGGGNVDYFGEQDRIRSFEVDLGFGEADLWLRDGHIEGGGFPKAINWKGSGTVDVEIDVAGGNVTAKLE